MNNQTAYLVEPMRFEIRESPMPEYGDDDVLVESRHMGICGSDVMFYHDPTVGGALQVELPVVLGHECAGTVVAAGKNVKNLKPGDSVALEPGIPCCKCEYCLQGRYNLCREVDFMAAPPFLSGALNKYIAHPAAFTFRLADNMTTVEGAMIEPLSVGIHAAGRAQAEPGKSIVILGAGCIGLMTLLACRSRGATNITVVDLYDNRLGTAAGLGAAHVINGKDADTVKEIMKLTGNQGADIVFETAGSVHTARQTPFMVKPGGKVVIVGNIHSEVPYDFFTMNCKEADVLSVFRYRNIYPTAIESVAGGKIDVKQIATDFYKFSEVNEAFSCALNNKRTALKVVIEF